MFRLATIAVLVGLSGPALAEGAGTYAVQGANPGGEGAYKGTATLAQTGKGTWSMTWRVANDTYSGYGVGDGKVLAIAYTGGGGSGVVSYVANPDGSYSGIWTTAQGRSAGLETLTPR